MTLRVRNQFAGIVTKVSESAFKAASGAEGIDG